jgi:hypothetical protein
LHGGPSLRAAGGGRGRLGAVAAHWYRTCVSIVEDGGGKRKDWPASVRSNAASCSGLVSAPSICFAPDRRSVGGPAREG